MEGLGVARGMPDVFAALRSRARFLGLPMKIACSDDRVLNSTAISLDPRKWGMTPLDLPENAAKQEALLVSEWETLLFCRLSEPLLRPTAGGEEWTLHLGQGRTVLIEPVPGCLVVCLSLKQARHQAQEAIPAEPHLQSQ